MDHFEPHVYADLEFYITFITSNKSPNQNDTVLAAGHFVGCVVLRDGNQLFRIETEDWVVEISVWKKYIALATMDQQVKVVTLPSDGEFVVE